MNLILTQCYPPVIGGIENLMGELAAALVGHGEPLLVFADGVRHASDAGYVRRFGGWKVLRRWRKGRAAAATIRDQGVKRVFCDSWKSLECLGADDASKAKVIVFAHGSEYPVSPPPRKLRRIVAALAKADRVLAVSEAARRRMQKCGVNTDAVEIWHPPIAAAATPAGKVDLWGDGAPRVLTIARLARRKGVDVAIEAVARLRADFPSVRYVIGGSGGEEEALRALAQQRGMSPRTGGELNVVFAGVVSDEEKAALYGSADVFVLPVREDGDDMEGFGLVFLEAGLHGVPSICGKSGGAAEAVEDERTGLHCDGSDIGEVHAALARLLSDDALRRRLGDAARAKAEGNVWNKRIGELVG